MEEKSQGDPVTLQCFVFIGTISGAVEPAAIFQDRSAASFVGRLLQYGCTFFSIQEA